MSSGWGWGVLALVFLDEVLAVVALGYVGGRFGGWPWAVVVVLAAVAVWWTFASPKAPRGGPVVRPAVKVLVFGAACVGLLWSGHIVLALLLLGFSVVVNALAQTGGVRMLVDDLER
ncbi:MAG: DUF2568 domain-containing protein [Nocardioides sp.]